MSERPTFSPMWHRVRALKPRLRPHVQIVRQHYRGRRWHVVLDPSSNQFYRLSPVAHEMVCLLDGRRTVEEVWQLSLESHADAAATQPEVIELLSQLYNSNLLTLDASPETEQLLTRGRERVKRRLQQQAIGLMYFRIRLFNPDTILTWLEPLFRPVLNRWGFFAWAALVLFVLLKLVPQWDALVEQFQQFVHNPALWIWVPVVFIVTKAIHETGHGVICKRFGGQVPEFGFMMLIFFPAPYVDASACWGFPSKWRRMAVGAGGMIFELFVAALAGLVWLWTPRGELANDIAFNALLTASISTVIFNANPLMRFDGYYILSDLLEVPNLMQRSMKMLQHPFQVHAYGIREARPPTIDRGEATILNIYGWAALAYRIFLFFSITFFVMGQFFALGVVLAIWSAAAWFLIPAGKFVHWLATNGQLADRRARAYGVTLAMLAAAFIAVGAIPVPDWRFGQGVVESTQRSGVFLGTDGFVDEVYKGLGDRVEAQEPILKLRNQELEARLQLARAELAEAQAFERDMTNRNPTAAQIARDRVRVQQEIIAAVQKRVDELVLRAPHGGVLVGTGPGSTDPRSLVGVMGQRGQAIAQIVDLGSTRIHASLSTAQALPLVELGQGHVVVRARPLSAPDLQLIGSGVRVIEAGRRELPHPSLGFGGGGTVETDAGDRTGTQARTPQFSLLIDELRPVGEREAEIVPTLLPGERVKLRFTLPSRPLLSQWIDRLRRMIQGRIDV